MNVFIAKGKQNRVCRCSTCGRKVRAYMHGSYGLYGCKYHLLIYFKYDGDNVETMFNAMDRWEELNSNIGGFNYAK